MYEIQILKQKFIIIYFLQLHHQLLQRISTDQLRGEGNTYL